VPHIFYYKIAIPCHPHNLVEMGRFELPFI
jgi:hypothetical protein